MATAQVKLNAVSPSVTAKSQSQPLKTDTSFSDILNKENNVSASKGSPKESKTNNIVSEKYSKESGKAPAQTDNSTADKANEKVSPDRNNTVYKAKDSTYRADRDTVESSFAEETENGEGQDENVKTLMAILANLIAEISKKTGADEACVKDFIAENNLTSENLLDINSWKEFVTKVSGLENVSAILTNDEAFQKLSDISEILDKHLDEMGQMTAGMTEGVTDEKQAGERLSEPEKKDVLSLNEILAKMFEEQKKVELVVTRKETDVEETIEQDIEGSVAIVPLTSNIDDAGLADTQAGFEQGSHSQRGENKGISAEATGVSPQKLFDNIAANIQKLEDTGSLSEGTTARDILNQVTSQISNLHAPDKTSLEFMLTPETLGKVTVNVSSKQGVLQAEFRVESAEAKTALESQMAELKLNFENQGLKVATVSVMISENGIGSENQSKNSGEEGKRNNKRNRSFSLDREEGIDNISVSPDETMNIYTDEGTGNNINLGV